MEKRLPVQFSGIRKFIGLAAGMLFLLLGSLSSNGQSLVNQDFTTGTVGNSVTASPISWGSNGTGTGTFLIANATPLTYSGYNGGGGNYVAVTKTAAGTVNVGQTFTSTSNTNTYYYSFLLNTSAIPTASTYFAALSTTVASGSYFARLYMQASGAGYNVGIARGSGAAAFNASPTVLAVNTTYLIIVKYVYVTGNTNDLAYIWVNPVITSEPTTASAEASDLSANIDGSALAANGVFTLRSNTTTANYTIDGIKVGTGTTSALAYADLAPAVTAVATLNATPGSLDFGTTQTVGTTSTKAFSLSGANLTANTTVTSSAGTYLVSTDNSTFTASVTLTPAQLASPQTIYVQFKPANTTPTNETVTVTSAGAANQVVNLTGTGVAAVSPTLVVAPGSLDFGTTQVIGSTSASKTFTITGSNLTAGGTVSTSAPYKVSRDNSIFSTSITFTAAELMATTSPTVYVQFTPASTTTATGAVTVTSTGAATQTVNLTGTGVSPPTLGATPGAIDFGTTQAVGSTSAAQTFSVSGANLTASVTLTTAAPYSVSADNSTYGTTATFTAAQLATAQTAYVKFTPTGTTAAPGNVAVSSTGATTVNVTLTGTGVAAPPTLTVSPTTLAFGVGTFVGTSATKTFTVSGVNLTGDGTVATTAPYLVSRDGVTFSSSVIFTAAELAATTKPIVTVQFSPTNATAAPASVTVNSAGATQVSVALTGTGAALATTNPANHVVISEIYGGGGNTSAIYTNDFVELYNPTSADVDISNWSVQYAAATATAFTTANSTVIPAGSIIKAHGYFLIKEASGGAVGAALPASDLTGSVNLSATTGKVALVNNATALTAATSNGTGVVDYVGFGTSTTFEGAGATVAPSNTTSIERKVSINSTAATMAAGGSEDGLGNGYDSDNNAADFLIPTTPNPQSSSSPVEPLPVISTTGSLANQTTTVGTASASGTFSVSGVNIVTSIASPGGGILITPPAGFEVSSDNSNFFPTITLGAFGTQAPRPVYIRLAAADTIGTYSGTLTLTSAGATTITAPSISGTVGAVLATVTTTTVTTIGVNSATLGGTVSATGGVTVTESGVVYSTTANPTTANNKTAISSGAGTFSQPVSGLLANSTYHVRAYAINSVGTSYGTDVSFTTATPASPSVSVTGTPLTALTATYGTASASTSFSVSGANMNAGITVTPPAGFEVSTDNVTFSSTVTVGAAGTIAATPIYVRLLSTDVVNSYSGNIILSSTGLTSVNVPTAVSTVTGAPITIAATAVSKPYGTVITGAAGSTAYTLTGSLQNGNTLSSITIAYGTGALANATVNTYTGSVTPSVAVGANGFLASNYAITYTSANLAVTPAGLTITATGPGKTYGTALTAGTSTTNFTASATVNGETVTSVTLTPNAAGATANTAAGAVYTVTPSAATGTNGFSAGNYNITYVPFNGTVTKVNLTVTATGINKVYDGTTTATVNLTDNRVSGDVLTTAYTAATFADKNVGTAKTVNVSGITISGAAAGNYTVNTTAATTANITVATATVTAKTDTKTYDKTPASAVAPLISGIATGDAISTAPTQTFNTASIGIGKILTPAGLVINDGNGGLNYNITYVTNITGVINSATLTYTATPASRTFGSANPAFTGTVTGFVGGDTQASVTTGTLSFTSTATAASPVGNYAINGSGLTAANYVFAQAPANGTALTVTQPTLTITANSVSKTAGSVLTGGAGSTAFSVTGLQNSDAITSVTITYGAGALASAGTGTYLGSVVASNPVGSLTASNYNIVFVPGDIVVSATPTPAIAFMGSLPALNTTYGTASATASFNVSGLNMTAPITVTAPNGFEVSASSGSGFGSSVSIGAAGTITSTPVYIRVAATTPAGSYTNSVILSSTGANNVSVPTTSSLVSPKALLVSATGVNKPYDGTTTATVTLSDNRISGDVFTVAYTSAAFINKNVGLAKTVNVSGIILTGAAAANYTANTTATTTANISAVAVTVTAQTDSKIYTKTTGSAIVPLVSGLVGTDVVGTAPVETFDNSNVGTAKVLTPSGLVITDGNSGGNYTVTYVNNSTGVITAKGLTVTAQTDTRAYNGTTSSSIAPVIGGTLVGGDAITTAATQTFNNASVGTGKTLTAAGLVISDGNGGNNYAVTYTPNTTGVITAATLTYTATPVSKTYGSANPAFTGTLTGFAGSETQASATSGTLSFTSTATTNSAVGSYAITGSGLTAANYIFAQAPGNATALTITPQTLVVTANGVSKPAGTAITGASGSTAFSISGLQNGETAGTVTIAYGAGSAAGDVPNIYPGSVVASALTGGNFTASNYNISYVAGTLTVTGTLNPVITTAGTLSALSTTYGTASSTGSFTVSGTNMTAGVLVTAPTGFEVSASPGSGFGSSVTVGSSGTINTVPVYIRLAATTGAGTYSGNVSLTSSGATSVSVTQPSSTVGQRALVVSATGVNKVYTGTTASTVTLSDNRISGDVLTATYTSASFTDKNVGNGKVVNVTGISISGSAAANYSVNTSATTSANITAAQVTVTAQAGSKIYTKTTASAATPLVTGLVGTDVVATAATETYANANVGSGKVLTAAGLVINDGNGGLNYTISYVTNTAGVITTATATVTAQTDTKAYDKTTASAVAPVVTGLASGDIVATAPTQTFNTANVGSGKTLTASGLVINDGNGGANYTISYVANATGVITTKGVTVTAQTDTRAYNGTTSSSVVPVVSALLPGDVIATAPTQTFNTSTVGTGKILIPAGLVINDGNGGANYTITYLTNNTGVITIATLTYTATTATKAYGTANPTFTGTLTGFIAGDTQASATTGTLSFSSTATAFSPAGSYAITGSGLTSANYIFAQAAANNTALTITTAPLTITATSLSKNYGSVNPTLAVTYTGFVGTDNAASLSVAPIITTTAVTSSQAGTYPISVNGAAAANYSISYVAGTLTVNKVNLAIAATNVTRNYGVANPTLTATYTGFVNGDTQASLTTQATISTTATITSLPGIYPITVSAAASNNYNISYIAGTLTVLPSTNATLANLSLSTGTLSPTFAAATTSYTASVANTVTSITVTPTTGDATATVKVNGTTVASGSASGSIALRVGTNIITTVVTAQDGITTSTYTVTLIRAAANNAFLANLTVSSGSVSPVFSSGTFAYTVPPVEFSTTSVDVTPTLADPTASVIVITTQVSSGSPVTANLNVADNLITIIVTAQDGVTKQTYTVLVHRGLAPEVIFANNILTPNGDGKNDFWVVKDIQSYPNNSVIVFDRAGRTVFSKQGYANDWGGTLNGSPLAEDTYYYVVNLGPGLRTFKGYITLVRSRR